MSESGNSNLQSKILVSPFPESFGRLACIVDSDGILLGI